MNDEHEILAEYYIYSKSKAKHKIGYEFSTKYSKISAHMLFLKGICEYLGRGTKQDYMKASKTLHKATSLGSIYAPAVLGYMCDNGIGLENDTSKAYAFYTLGAERGDFEAMYNLAEMYREGLVIRKNIKLCNHWIKRANMIVSNLYGRLANRIE